MIYQAITTHSCTRQTCRSTHHSLSSSQESGCRGRTVTCAPSVSPLISNLATCICIAGLIDVVAVAGDGCSRLSRINQSSITQHQGCSSTHVAVAVDASSYNLRPTPLQGLYRYQRCISYRWIVQEPNTIIEGQATEQTNKKRMRHCQAQFEQSQTLFMFTLATEPMTHSYDTTL